MKMLEKEIILLVHMFKFGLGDGALKVTSIFNLGAINVDLDSRNLEPNAVEHHSTGYVSFRSKM